MDQRPSGINTSPLCSEQTSLGQGRRWPECSLVFSTYNSLRFTFKRQVLSRDAVGRAGQGRVWREAWQVGAEVREESFPSWRVRFYVPAPGSGPGRQCSVLACLRRGRLPASWHAGMVTGPAHWCWTRPLMPREEGSRMPTWVTPCHSLAV